MKVCSLCGDTYLDHVEFCFEDGEVLAPFVEASAVGSTQDRLLSRPLTTPTANWPRRELDVLSPPSEPLPATTETDPRILALVAQVETAVRASVAAAERREQRRRSAEAWRKLLSRFGIALGS